jgi:hypothetical protein
MRARDITAPRAFFSYNHARAWGKLRKLYQVEAAAG